jgi:type IV pilus assembly protein PilA
MDPMTRATRLIQQKLLLNRLIAKKGRKGLAQGFTLLELMIVVAIIGILSAVAIPQFLGVRDRSELQTMVGEAVGLAKECAVGQVTKTDSGTVDKGSTDVTGTCNGSSATAVTLKVAGSKDIAGIKCLDKTSAAGEKTATISVSQDGALSCNWS